MTWLLAHMWLALLLAALFGGLIGWALRHSWRRDEAIADNAGSVGKPADTAEMSARLVELETQLAAERDEVAALTGRVDATTPASSFVAEPEEGTLEWRNRYLESRVRFLEKQIAEDEEARVEAPQPADDAEDEATRLVWRNRYLEGRVRYLEDELAKGGSLTIAPVESPARKEKSDVPVGDKPVTLESPRNGRADNLKKIGGVGPKIEKLLNGLGIFHFDQIAEWSEAEIAWVNAEISFKGRIERENWVEQARSLANGLQPEAKG